MPVKPALTSAEAVPDHLQARLQAAGLRRTLATRAVLGVFLARTGQGLTHAQVLQALRQRGHSPDRVTLYRLLERLAACDVLDRHSDERRTWRFTLQESGARAPVQGPVPRFECRSCGQERALSDVPLAGQRGWRDFLRALQAQGEQVERIDVAVHGVCARCAATPGGA